MPKRLTKPTSVSHRRVNNVNHTSWERGFNKKTNGLLRQYFPKKSDFKTISKKKIEQTTSKLNFGPRKTHHFKTLFEA